MNPCFFIRNERTNHLEFHYRSLKSTTVPHQFGKIEYVPDQFETKSDSKISRFQFNLNFCLKSYNDPNLKEKVFAYDREIIKKFRNNSIAISIIPFFGLHFISKLANLSMTLKRIPFMRNPYKSPPLLLLFSCLSAQQFANYMSSQQLFLTGILGPAD